jgi:hypothetical protein
MTYGFNLVEAAILPPADLAKCIAGIKATGATYARMSVPWGTVESTQGTYNLAPFVTAVNAALTAGLKPLLVLDHPKPQSGFWFFASDAAWATPVEYGKFCAAVAKAFPQVLDYEIWNEPNLLSFFNPVDPAVFAPYLIEGYTAAKKANPAAQFALGGLAATVDYTGFVFSWTPFLFGVMKSSAQPSHYLTGLYAAGAKGHFDAVAYHPYVGNPSTFAPLEPIATAPSIVEIAALHDVMNKNGDGALEIWATEWGFSTAQVSEVQQASWLAEQWTSMATYHSYVTHVCPFTWRDWVAKSTAVNDNYGVLRFDYSPKPALAALAAVAK